MDPCPEHFIIRPATTDRRKAIVPLIAVDQLPSWIELTGVPRELDAKKVIGMKNLGVVARADEETYMVCLQTDKIQAILSRTQNLGCHDAGRHVLDDVPKIYASQNEDGVCSRSKRGKQDRAVGRGPSESQLAHHIHDTDKEAGPNRTGEEVPIKSIIRHHGTSTKSQDCNKHSIEPEERQKGTDRESSASPMLQESRHNIALAGNRVTVALNRDGASAPARTNTNDKSSKFIGRPAADIRPHLTQARSGQANLRQPRGHPSQTYKPDTSYCRHWCHYGTCKWGRECRYQHRMPATREGLREVGLRELPMWCQLMMGLVVHAADGGQGLDQQRRSSRQDKVDMHTGRSKAANAARLARKAFSAESGPMGMPMKRKDLVVRYLDDEDVNEPDDLDERLSLVSSEEDKCVTMLSVARTGELVDVD